VLLLTVVHWPPAVIVLAGVTGTGAILVQIMTETGLQRTLPHDVFGRAYGLAIPVSIGGIGAGSLIASALASTVGLTGALLVCGAITVAYGALLLRGTNRRTPASAPGDIGRDSESVLVA
jgi:predicted MFS family arabinose efflux permease